jgi:transcriptional regulator NrdR family protein
VIKCPGCGGETKALETRAGGDGRYIRRRRQCLTCDQRVTTSEVIIGERSSADVVVVERPLMEAILRDAAAALGDRRAATRLIDELLKK